MSRLLPRPDRARRATTLMEVLLVLGILVMIASLAWPALNRAIETQRLEKAADLVRASWGRARVKALSTGRIHMFQYAVGGDRYTVQRRTAGEVTIDGVAEDLPTGFADASYENPTPFGQERQLPEGVKFLGSQMVADTRAQMVAAEVNQFRPVEQGWSVPIFFYPDGTTSTARLVLKNQRGRTIELALRGLTGVATVGEVQGPEEQEEEDAQVPGEGVP